MTATRLPVTLKAYLSFGLAVVATAPLATPATAQQHFPPETEVRQIAQDRVDRRTAVDVMIGMIEVDPHSVVFTGAGGFSSATGSIDRMLFEIGSITKTFTGIVLADMVRRGEVSLDTPVDDLLPESVEVPTRNGQEITLLDLATHRSSLPRLPTNYVPVDMADPYADFTVELMYEFLNEYELPRDIGSEYEYSNLAMGLLGHALARRAGMSYEDLVRDRLLGPLGMDETVIALDSELETRLLQGHDAMGYPTSTWEPGAVEGAGGFRSSVWDMMTFLRANIDAARGAQSSPVALAIRDSHEIHNEVAAGRQSIGLNWMHMHDERGDFVWHGGGTGGYRAFVGFDAEKGIGAIVLSNQAQRIDDIGAHLLNGSELRPPGSPPPLRESVDVDRSILEQLVGDYRVDPLRVASFTLEGDELWTQMTGQPRLRVHAESESEFYIRGVGVDLEFEMADDGTVAAVIIHQGGAQRRAPRMR